MKTLIHEGKQGKHPDLHGIDLMVSAVERAQPDSPQHDEFLRQIDFYEVFQPRAVVIEQPPPTATPEGAETTGKPEKRSFMKVS